MLSTKKIPDKILCVVEPQVPKSNLGHSCSDAHNKTFVSQLSTESLAMKILVLGVFVLFAQLITSNGYKILSVFPTRFDEKLNTETKSLIGHKFTGANLIGLLDTL